MKFYLSLSVWSCLVAVASLAHAGPSDDPIPIEGVVRPAREVTLKASIVAQVKEVFVRESQAVEAGEPLVQLDAAVQEAVVQHAEAAKRQADLVLESTRKMRGSDAATTFEMRNAETEAEQAEATLRLERERLALYRLRAPFRGHVMRIDAREGSTVNEDNPVLVFAELDPLKAEFRLPAAWYDDLKVGEQYRLQAGEPVNAAIVATCEMIEPAIDPASQTFRCVLRIDNAGVAMPSGFHIRWNEPEATLATGR